MLDHAFAWAKPPIARLAVLTSSLFFVFGTTAQAQGYVDETVPAGLMMDTVGLTPGSHGRGAATADFDGDGDLDLVIPGLGATPIRYFENDGTARFTERTLSSGLPSVSGNAISAHAGDIDNDGDQDLIIGRMDADSLFVNDGTGHFTDETFRIQGGSPGPTYSVSFGDFDLDGDSDLAFGVWSPTHPNLLYENQGNGNFVEIGANARLDELSMTFVNSWVDYNEDGLPDLYCANDKGQFLHPNSLYENQGNGTFIDVAPALGADARMFSMGLDHADIFNDGGIDMYVTDAAPDHLFLHWEGNQYVERHYDYGVQGGVGYTGWGCYFFDYDNDGWLDIYAVDEDQPNPLYRNPGAPAAQRVNFPDVGTQVGAGATRNQSALLVADWDNDGRMDILQIYRTSIVGEAQRVELRMNRIPFADDNHWIKIRTVGTVSNRDGQGTQIRLWSNGIRQHQQVRSSVGFCGTGDTRVHFGLGTATTVDRIELTWPSGQIQVLENVPADRILTIEEPQMDLVGTPQTGSQVRLRMAAPEDPHTHYAILLASNSGTLPLGDGRMLPLVPDGLTAATLIPGNGVLANNVAPLFQGRGEAFLTIPAEVGLIGTQFFTTGLTFTPGLPTIGTVYPSAIPLQILN